MIDICSRQTRGGLERDLAEDRPDYVLAYNACCRLLCRGFKGRYLIILNYQVDGDFHVVFPWLFDQQEPVAHEIHYFPTTERLLISRPPYEQDYNLFALGVDLPVVDLLLSEQQRLRREKTSKQANDEQRDDPDYYLLDDSALRKLHTSLSAAQNRQPELAKNPVAARSRYYVCGPRP